MTPFSPHGIDLVRIICINWYLYGQKSIELLGNTALIGENKAGKSSLLDAIQMVLFGGSEKFAMFNAAAGKGKSKRKALHYCLGIVYDHNDKELASDPIVPPRPSAITHLALVFRASDSGRPTSVLVSFESHLASGRCEVALRLVLPGVELTLNDLLDEVEGGKKAPREFEPLKRTLLARIPNKEDVAGAVNTQPLKHVAQFLLKTSPDQHLARIDAEGFIRNLSNALALRSNLENVNEFVRTCILPRNEDDKSGFKDVRRSFNNWKELARHTSEAKAKQAKLDAALAKWADYGRRDRLRAYYDYISIQSERESVQETHDLLAGGLEENASRQRVVGEREAELEREYARLLLALGEAKSAYAASDAGRLAEGCQERIDKLTARLEKLHDKLGEARQLLGRIGQAAMKGREFQPAAILKLAQKARDLAAPELAADVWPGNAREVSELLEHAGNILNQAADETDRRRSTAGQQHALLKQEADELANELNGMANVGRVQLKPATASMATLFEQAGVASTILCNALELTDERWRPAIEVILGGDRETLLVAEGDYRAATDVVRDRMHDHRGVKLAAWRGSERFAGAPAAGTLAALVKTDSEIGRRLINRKLGTIFLVAPGSDFSACPHDRAIMPAKGHGEFLLRTGGVDTVLDLTGLRIMIGKNALALRKEAIESRLKDLAEPLQKAKQSDDGLKAAYDAVTALEIPADLAAGLAGAANDRQAAAKTLVGEQALLAKLTKEQADGPGKVVSELESQVKAAEATRKELQADQKLLGEEQAKGNLLLEQNAARLDELAALVDKTVADPAFERDRAMTLFDRVRNEAAHAPERVQKLAQERSSDNRRRATAAAAEFFQEVREYQSQYGGLEPGTEDLPLVHKAVLERRDQVANSELADYAEKTAAAERKAVEIFKSTIILTLNDNRTKTQKIIDGLNVALKNHPLGSEYYKISSTPAEKFAPLVALVEHLKGNEWAFGTLFDEGGGGESPHAVALELLRTAMENDQQLEELEDYRNYQTFDIHIMDVKTGRLAGRLSSRMSIGSGGEQQAPYYIATCAALAQGYHLRFGGCGLRLALFDEAFSHLDPSNAEAILKICGSFGLQLFTCAPGTHLGVMREQMTSLLEIYRDGGKVTIESSIVTAKGRELLASGKPQREVTSEVASGEADITTTIATGSHNADNAAAQDASNRLLPAPGKMGVDLAPVSP